MHRVLAGSLALSVGHAAFRLVPAHAVQINAPAFDLIPFATLGLGTNSGCSRPAKLIITDEAEWRRVWAIHTHGQMPAPTVPPVDFSKEVVVALLMGASPAPDATIEIAQIVYGPRETLVYWYANHGAVPRGAKRVTAVQPFHFAAVDKPPTPLRFVNALGAQCSSCGKP